MSKVRVRHGDDEFEVEGTEDFISSQLKHFYDRMASLPGEQSPTSIKQQILDPPTIPKGGKTPTPAEFYKQKKKTDGLSQLLIFAKYLEEYEGKTEFTGGDVNRVANDAKLSKDIHAQYFTNGVKQGLLRKHGKHYSLTLSAEEVLASM